MSRERSEVYRLEALVGSRFEAIERAKREARQWFNVGPTEPLSVVVVSVEAGVVQGLRVAQFDVVVEVSLC